MVPAQAYLQVRVTGSDQVEAVAIWRERVLLYTFPLHCVTTGRPLLYTQDGHRIYGPMR